MKKSLRSLMALLFAVALICSLGAAAFADSGITYSRDGQLSVSPDDDIFDSFKDVMPGDTRSEKITVRNEFTGTHYVFMYVQAVPHTEAGVHRSEVANTEASLASMNDFLSQLRLSVTQDGNPISYAPADQPAGLEDAHLIGAFRGRGESLVEVTLEVPITMGNEYAERMGEIDWVFTAVEWNDPALAATGDDSNAGLWFGLLLLALAIAPGAALINRRKKSN